MHTDTVTGIRQIGTDNLAYEDDAGEMAFGPINARTLFFDTGEEALYSHMSAAPGGHETVEEVRFARTLTAL